MPKNPDFHHDSHPALEKPDCDCVVAHSPTPGSGSSKQVSKTTNDLLLKNAEMLKSNTIETARENERGLVDIETLKKTQASLISTLEETIKIQQEGRSKRAQAEQELLTMENELKQKLLSLQ